MWKEEVSEANLLPNCHFFLQQMMENHLKKHDFLPDEIPPSAGDALRFGQPLGSWVTDQMNEMDVDFRGRVGVFPLLGQFQHV